ncbi:hypothetical protein NLJ89_g5619 [Agrocybe chaxingu]|uniref:RNA helicase n=1 Tax=Agrocybe chaxingu TaxID=84603 RepID=A0A9W8K084_9AGAR|nr:hypothetical protein NLJ89_g5619 [Agrocybe chaxingu]
MSNCPNVLTNGTCSDEACPHNHAILSCDACNFVFSTDALYQAHLTTDKHKRRVAGSSIASFCSLCRVNIPGGRKAWKQHVQGQKHRSQASILGVSPNVDPQAATTTVTSTYCELCQALVQNCHWNSHIRGMTHKTRETFTRYRSAVEEAEADKHDVFITGNFNLDILDPAVAGLGVESTVTIRTSLPHSKCALVDAKLASSQGTRLRVSGFRVTLSGTSRNVTSSRPLTLTLVFKQPFVGRYEDRVEFRFEDTQLRKRFVISRTLKAIVGNKAEHEALQPRTPYVPRSRTARKAIAEIIEGVRPPALNAIPYVGRLPKADIPTQLQGILSGSESTSRLISHVRRVFLPEALNSVNYYGRHFKYLLWIEEYKMAQDLERYDIPDATLTRHSNYFYLSVPGLAEKRPSVLVGDQILVQEQGATDGRWFEGHVHVVRQAEVGLRFHGSFGRYSEGRRFHVRFKLNRIPVRRQHQAMDTIFIEDRVLFPLGRHLSSGPVKTKADVPLRLYNKLIANNQPQLQAVISAVSLAPGSPPFVVFGPPGTGKTITVVEAILQIVVGNPQARVLACAPSNSAADLIASRLRAELNADELFRFYAPSRFKDQVPDDLRDFAHTNGDGHFTVPPMARVKRFRVIVTTHIFVDEAGQATEPEAFVSIKTMADPNTNVVLSGDPKQLGPIIRSSVARELGLELSYLERLMNSDTYDLRSGVVKLTKNFRSHPSILRFPNERFYACDLEPFANSTTINYYINSPYLPSKKFPIVFHSVSGKDDRESSSPSFFNIDEVLQVKSYVQKLKEDRRFRTADSDIGIIAPYHAQCQKLRNSLRSIADGVKVGSVEEFQGQERKVIIVSTVRSSKEFVEYDLRHTLGFVANPRRFNVAVTRAQAMLIVVGDPNVLGLDPLWRSFLNYVHSNGGWTGPEIPWDPTLPVDEAGGYDKTVREAVQLDMNEFARRMESLTMAEVEEELDANIDRPWRDVE